MTDEFRRGAAWTWALVHEICPELCDHKNWPVLKDAYEEGTARTPEDTEKCELCGSVFPKSEMMMIQPICRKCY